MLSLNDIRGYIAGLGIAEDNRVFIGKLDNKKEKSIGIYNRKGEGALTFPLGGRDYASYDTKRVSLLIHWSRNVLESEKQPGSFTRSFYRNPVRYLEIQRYVFWFCRFRNLWT